MFTVAALWIPFTLVAAAGQVARNAMQRSLTGPLGTWGATNIRFLFGFPFSVLFLVLVLAATGDRLPAPGLEFWPWLLLGMGLIAAGAWFFWPRPAPPAAKRESHATDHQRQPPGRQMDAGAASEKENQWA